MAVSVQSVTCELCEVGVRCFCVSHEERSVPFLSGGINHSSYDCSAMKGGLQRLHPHAALESARGILILCGVKVHLAKRPPMGSIAHSHIMAGDARSPLDLRGVFLIEANSRVPEIPPRNTRGVRRNMNKFIVILLRSR